MITISMSTILELLPKWTEMTTVTQLCSTTFPKWNRTSMRWTKTSLTSKNMPRNHSLFSETESQKSQISIWYRTSTQKVMLKVANQYLLSNKALSKTFSTRVGSRMTTLIILKTITLGPTSVKTTISCQWRKWAQTASSLWWWPGHSVIYRIGPSTW